MQLLLMPFRGIAAPIQTPLMTRNRILMRLQTAIFTSAMTSYRQYIIQLVRTAQRIALGLPFQRQITRAHHLDKVHIIKRRIIRHLLRLIQRIQMMVRPRHTPRTQPLRHALGHLRPKPQMMDLMRKRMRHPVRRVQVIIQIVHVHGAVAETAAGRDVEIANDFVDAEAAFDAAALAALGVELFAVVLALALFDVFAAAEGPGDAGIGFADFFAGVAAVGFGGCGWGGRAVAVAAVVGGEVGGFFGGVAGRSLYQDMLALLA